MLLEKVRTTLAPVFYIALTKIQIWSIVIIIIVSVQTKQVRDAILDSTDRLLALYGYKKMTIEDLCLDVGIGKGSISAFY